MHEDVGLSDAKMSVLRADSNVVNFEVKQLLIDLLPLVLLVT